jgi:signal recognition particle receptor subunit beta
MQINHARRELTLKVVYYGPALSGKTTNLRQIHARSLPDSRTNLMQVETKDDRTLFFDLLPVHFESASGFRVKVKMFTVPGQVIHRATRRVVLQSADAVAFISDSRKESIPESNASWKSLHEDMRANRLDPEEIPIVIQFNKMDLPGAKTAEELAEAAKRGQEPILGAVALHGQGVLETLHVLLQQAHRQLEARAGINRLLGLSEEEFLGGVFKQLNCSGTGLAELYPAPRASEVSGA